jgi:N-acetylated-alpha-linked acidic dipeptidase
VDGYVKELGSLQDSMRLETEEDNRLLSDGALLLSFDPTKHLVAPKAKEEVPFLNLAPLENAVARLTKAANALEVKRKMSPVSDAALIQTERVLLGPGLPGRPWYRHTIYAPGLYTGYGVKTLPGVREAIEQRRWKEAEEQAVLAAAALDRLSEILEKS